MNYVLEPSLQHTALVKVVAILWNPDDVKKLLEESDYRSYYTYYPECKSRTEKIEAIVVKKVAKLPLPKQMKEKILCFIRPIGLQIIRWKKFLKKGGHLRVDLSNEFCWSSQGTIDKKKTAELIIKDYGIDITTRYSLACIHCLEDEIPKLFNKIPKCHRKSLYCNPNVYVSSTVKFWTCYIKKDACKLNRMIKQEMGCRISPYRYAFINAVHDGYTVAAEYFFQKLTVSEADLLRNVLSMVCKPYLGDNYADILCLLLPYLDEEEQIRVFESNPPEMLSSLLDYPYQHFFMKTAIYMWDLIERDDYADVLGTFTRKIKDGYKDFDYQKLLGEFWQKIPIDHKRHVLSQSRFYSIIRDLFEMGDEDNIRLIFTDATPEEKKRIFYHDSARDICENLLNGDDPLSLLKYFIRECLPSKDEVIGFKEHLESGEIGEFQSKFLHVLDEVIAEFSKRKQEGGDNSKAKKVCSAEFSDMIPSSEK